MYTIQRKVVIYTTLRIVGYLLVWKYSCFIFGTENIPIKATKVGPARKALNFWSETEQGRCFNH